MLASKTELQQLNNELSELNKQHRVSQYRLSQYDRTLKYNLYDPNRSMVESQLNLSSTGAKTANRGNSQYRTSQYQNYKGMSSGAKKRDMSYMNTRNMRKEANNSYAPDSRSNGTLNLNLTKSEAFLHDLVGRLSSKNSKNKLK